MVLAPERCIQSPRLAAGGGLATQLLSARVAVLGFAVLLLVAVVALVSRRLLRT